MINNLITQVLKVQSDTFKCLILWDRAWASVSGPCEEAPVGSAGPSRASAGSDAGSWELINEDNRDGGEEQKSPVIIDKKLPERIEDVRLQPNTVSPPGTSTGPELSSWHHHFSTHSFHFKLQICPFQNYSQSEKLIQFQICCHTKSYLLFYYYWNV